MNDRFKIRVWDKKNKTYAVIPYGNYALSDNGDLLWIKSENDFLQLNIEDYVVEQCTGLKDKNGKLIFENDVVSDYDGFKILVRWNDLELEYVFIPVLENNTEDLDIYPNECEIVGNIHTCKFSFAFS